MNRSRRAVLAACGAGLTALAGCSSLGAGEETPSYDGGRLASFGDKEVPRPPTTFPVSVPDAMVSRHRERARTLVERVPEQPDVPNGATGERLREERNTVLDRLDATADGDGRTRDGLEQVHTARSIRGRAAAVEAAYRAATDDITREAVADRRAQLRSDRFAFERDWTYRGDDPATAVVVHRESENLLLEARPAVDPDRAFPGDPSADVFGAGEVARHLEVGHAALSDARRLRTRYREGLSDPRPYRTPISVAASRLQRLGEQYRRELDEYADPGYDELPFDQSIEGTPVERLYRRTVHGVEIFRTNATQARHRGDRATALVEAGISLTALRALESIVADVRNDRVAVPESVDGIEAAREEAVDALERAWSTAPTVLAAAVAHWSWVLVADVQDRLSGPASERGEPPDTSDGHQVWANYVIAAEVAAAVPRTVGEIRTALREATA